MVPQLEHVAGLHAAGFVETEVPVHLHLPPVNESADLRPRLVSHDPLESLAERQAVVLGGKVKGP
jgi:hypothetical protein